MPENSNHRIPAGLLVCAFAAGLAYLGGMRGLQAQVRDAGAIVDSLQKGYDATADFTVDFRQETVVKTLNRSLKAWGQLYFKRPGKMLWRYEEPKDQFVLADGEFLYYFQPEQNQIIKSPLKNAFRSDIPLSFLLGMGSLKDDFTAALKASKDGGHVLRLEPKGEAAGVGEIFVGVSKSTSDLIWVSVRDAAGNLTTIQFGAMQKGTGLRDSIFTLKIPNGADIVELAQ